jgi:hypothetical protein
MATGKQKKALDRIVENHGNVSKSMREAGYTEATAKNPSNLTKSKGFQELADQYLPDDMLLRALSDDIDEKVKNRKAELELAFKIKGKMIDKAEVEVTLPTPIIPLDNVQRDDSNDEDSISEEED